MLVGCIPMRTRKLCNSRERIPADGLLDTLLKLQTGLPAEFSLQLGGVDGITQIMTGTVGDKGNQIHILAFLSAQQTIHRLNHHLDDIDVLPLVEATDVIRIGNLSLMENHVDGTGMILYIQPVAHILTLTIDWQWLAVADVLP